MFYIFDKFLSDNESMVFMDNAAITYKQRCEQGMNPMSFSTRLIDYNGYLIEQVQSFLQQKTNLKLNHRWTQLQVWPVNSFSARHIHDDPRAGDANFTSMIYLNDDFDGGVFYTDDIRITPVRGRLTLFNGRDNWHGVTMVLDKPRYCIIFWWNVEE
jgi:hypothetical protein